MAFTNVLLRARLGPVTSSQLWWLSPQLSIGDSRAVMMMHPDSRDVHLFTTRATDTKSALSGPSEKKTTVTLGKSG